MNRTIINNKVITEYSDGKHVILLVTNDRNRYKMTIKCKYNDRICVTKRFKYDKLFQTSNEDICKIALKLTNKYTLKYESKIGRMRDNEYDQIRKLVQKYIFSIVLPF